LNLRALPLELCQLPDSEPGPSRDWDFSYETAFGKSRNPKQNESVTINRYCKRLPYSAAKFNLLQATGYVMHQQFNIQQLYALPTLYLRVLYLSENKQRLVPLTA